MSADPAPIRHAPIALWRAARAFLSTLHMLFGAPEDVARQRTLAHKPFLLLASWLRVGEALMRRLLIIEAAAYPAPNTPHTRRASDASSPHCLRRTDPDKPEDWRVCFNGALDRRRLAGKGCQSLKNAAGETPAVQARTHSAWPLAERYEALIRIFNAPAAYARRLAARLHTRAHLFPAMFNATREFAHRVDRAETITRAAFRAWRRATRRPDTS